MSVHYYTATSLDGYIADADNSIDWLLRLGDGSGQFYEKFMATIGALVMGSTTYQWILDNDQAATSPGGWPYVLPVWVFTSRDLRRIDGADITFVNGDVDEHFATIAESAAGKDVWVVGGGDLAGQFADNGLLDEITVAVAPVTLGSGAPLFPREITEPVLSLQSATIDGPFAMLNYRVLD